MEIKLKVFNSKVAGLYNWAATNKLPKSVLLALLDAQDAGLDERKKIVLARCEGQELEEAFSAAERAEQAYADTLR